MGALNRLVAFQSVGESPLDATQARLVLGVRATASDLPAELPADGVPVVQNGGNGPATVTLDAEPDEFGAFLSEVADTLTRQVEGWRRRVEEAIARWEDQGYRTTRLSGLLDRGVDDDPAEVLSGFVADVERLQALQAETAALAEDLAADPVFRDPDAIALAEACLARALEGSSPPPPPELIWVFDDLVESAGNRMALRSTREVAERPGVAYNPLVILGGAGVGKTHLLHALGNLLQAAPGAVVACLNTQDFTEELIEAIERDRVGPWRARYRRVTALLLDDVQLAAGRERTQEELFRLFNHLMEHGAQLAFTLSAPPSTIEHFEERLASRLAGGLEVVLPAPEREVRQAVVERLLGARYDKVDAELASFLAGRPAESVRAVQAMVQRVQSAADARHAEPDVALAREVLEGAAPKPVRPAPGVRTSGVGAGGFRSREKVRLGMARPRRAADRGAGADGDQGQPQGSQPSRRGPAARAGPEDRLPGGRRSAELRLHLFRRRADHATPRSSIGATDWATCWSGTARITESSCAGRATCRPGRATGSSARSWSSWGTSRARNSKNTSGSRSRRRSTTCSPGPRAPSTSRRASAPEREDFLVSINPESLLLEGARRVDEWSLIEKKIPSST